jgi:hypothetical protein
MATQPYPGLNPGLILALAVAGFACESSPASRPAAEQSPEPPTSRSSGPVPYRVPERTPAELERELARACSEARENGKLVLLELSAPWCKDCVRLQSMKQDPRVVQALTRYRELSVNVGEFDQHPTLLQAFGVRAIAHWELLEPTDCAAPPWRWRRVGHRTLEPETGKTRVTPEDLASWLEARSAT